MKRVMKTKAHTSGLNTRTKTRRKQLKGGGGRVPKQKGKNFIYLDYWRKLPER